MNKILILITFLITTLSVAQERKIDGIVAVVGDEIITESDINDAENYARSEGQTVTDKCSFVETMMKEKLILYKAKQDTLITVGNDEVSREVDSRLDGYRNYFGSDQNVLTNFKFKTMGELKNVLETMIKNQMYTQRKMASITHNIDVSPEYLKDFYNTHQEEFPHLNEEIEYAQIFLYPELSQDHKKELIDQLNDIKKQIQEGANFADMAKKYSQDPGSAENGGLIMNVKRGQMVKEFDAVAFGLEEGQISDPFETEYGYHIIYLQKRKGQILDLRHILLAAVPNKEEINAAIKKLEGIKDEIKSEKITFSAAALKYSDDKYTKYNGGVLSNSQTGDNRFEKIKLPTKILYNLSGLGKGDLSEVFEDKDNNRTVVKLLKITDVIPAHKMNLEIDYNRIKNFAQRTKENDIIEKWVENQIPTTFITVQNEYKKCNFSIDWLQIKKK